MKSPQKIGLMLCLTPVRWMFIIDSALSEVWHPVSVLLEAQPPDFTDTTELGSQIEHSPGWLDLKCSISCIAIHSDKHGLGFNVVRPHKLLSNTIQIFVIQQSFRSELFL